MSRFHGPDTQIGESGARHRHIRNPVYQESHTFYLFPVKYIGQRSVKKSLGNGNRTRLQSKRAGKRLLPESFPVGCLLAKGIQAVSALSLFLVKHQCIIVNILSLRNTECGMSANHKIHRFGAPVLHPP